MNNQMKRYASKTEQSNNEYVCRLIVSSRKEYPQYCCMKPLMYFREHSPLNKMVRNPDGQSL